MAVNIEEATYDAQEVKNNSAKLLYKYFCNNLLLGQWEVARSCLQQLHEYADIIGCDMHEVLIDVSENPYKRSLGSSTLSSPSHLSWLCLLECEKICDECSEEKISLLAKLSKDADFRLMLAELPQDTDSNIIKELYEFFRKCNNLVPISVRQPTSTFHTLSKNTVNYLKQLLLSKVNLAHLIISYLMQYENVSPEVNTDFVNLDSSTSDDIKTRNNETLQGIYIQCINTVLDHIEKTSIKKGEKLEQFSKLLGYYDPNAYWNYLQLRQLFTRLIEFSEKEDSLISKDKVTSLLIGRKTNYLIDEFCKIEYELLQSSKKDKEIDKLFEEEKCILQVCSDMNRQNRWMNIFLLSIKKKKHFLEMILYTALDLVKAEQFSLLDQLLRNEDFLPLKPMVLLLGWSYCSSCNIARQLLKVLWDENNSCLHTILTSSCKRLSYQIDLIQWCLEKAKPLIETSSSKTIASHERATNMLQNLSTHSVLFVLHQSTRISTLNPDEVLHLLRNTSHTESKDKNKKSVRFKDDKLSSSEPISIEQQCDISTFRSYCALKNIMDILDFCSKYFEHALMNPVCMKTSIRPKHLARIFSLEEGVSSSSDGEEWMSVSQTKQLQSEYKSADTNNFEQLYDTNVTKKIAATKKHLQQLHPLTFRVETMENLFSLLFVSHEDFNSEYVEDYDSGDEEGEVGSKLNSAENVSILSDEETPPIGKTFVFTQSSSKIAASQSCTISANYDEPFYDSKKAVQSSQSLNQQIIVCQPIDAKSTPTKKLSSTLTSLRRMSSINKSSDLSSSVNSGNMKIGFLANEYIVRDVLAMLKESLTDLNSSRFNLSGKEKESKSRMSSSSEISVTMAMEKLLMEHIKSSITADVLSQRITRLTQLIHEAQWRFQLVCDEHIPRQPGILLQKQIICSENDMSVFLSSSVARKDRSKSSKIEKVVSSEEDKEASGGYRQKNCSQSRAQCSSLSTLTCRTLGIIPLMLSTPDTLLSMCLSRGNFGQAGQVIKLFKLEKKDEASEVQFSESYKTATEKLCTLFENPEKTMSPSNRPGKMSIKALASVAAAGMASASITNITDDLLTMTTIPQLPKSNLPKTNKMTNFFTEVNVSTAILIDLMITSCQSWDLCNKMFDVIKSKMNVKNLTDIDNGGHVSETNIKGCFQYLSELQKVLDLSSENDIQMSYIGNTERYPNIVLKQSFVNMLLCATSPVVAHRLKNFIGVKEEIKHALERVQNETKTGGLDEIHLDDSLSSMSSIPSPNPSPRPSPIGSLTSRSSIKSESPTMHTVMKQLIGIMEKYLPTGGMIRLLKRSSSGMIPTNRNYLLSLYEHVKELAFLVAQSESKSPDSLVFPKNYFRMLQEGPILILGRLMFNKKLQPTRLEKVAAKLSLNLTHIIVHSCCPRIPSKHILPVLSATTNHEYSTVGTKVIYNCGVPNRQMIDQNPQNIVQDILSTVLHRIKDTAIKCNAKEIFDITCAKLFVQELGYEDVFTDTKNIQLLDLSLLITNDEKSSFFINLQNLMTLHMHLHFIQHRLQKQIQLENEESRSTLLCDEDVFTMSRLDNLVQRQKFSYHIGQLGIISLYDLQANVCGHKCIPTLQVNNITFSNFSKYFL